MRRVEYRIEEISPGEHGGPPPLVRLTERLNELGKQGWEVASLDLTRTPPTRRRRSRRSPCRCS